MAKTFARGAAGGAAVAVVGVLIVALGAPARDTALAAPVVEPVQIDVEIDEESLPTVTVPDDLRALTTEFDAQELAVMLAEDLAVESQAMRRAESELLLAADFGPRLIAMQDRMATSAATGEWVVVDYVFESLNLTTVTVAGGQGTDLALEATGTALHLTYDPDGVELSRVSTQFETTFVLRQSGDDRWLILDAFEEL